MNSKTDSHHLSTTIWITFTCCIIFAGCFPAEDEDLPPPSITNDETVPSPSVSDDNAALIANLTDHILKQAERLKLLEQVLQQVNLAASSTLSPSVSTAQRRDDSTESETETPITDELESEIVIPLLTQEISGINSTTEAEISYSPECSDVKSVFPIYTGSDPDDSTCSPEQYHCKNPDQCVPKEEICSIDRAFGSSVQDPNHRCYDQLYCKTGRCNGFQCGRQCIPHFLVCNGKNECVDGTDELFCAPTDRQSSSCCYHLTATSGSFSSLIIPKQSPRSVQKCSVLISTHSNQTIWLTFNFLRTRSYKHPVKVYDGPTTTSPVLFSGSGSLNRPAYSIRSSSQHLYVEYPSYKQRDFGIDADYTSVPNLGVPYYAGCGGYVVNRGLIAKRRDVAKGECIWYVENKNNQTILLSRIDDFATPSSIVVRDGWTSEGKILNPPTESNDGKSASMKSVYSSSNQMRVSFNVTSETKKNQEWIVTNISTLDCWSNLTAASGTIKTPDYPSPYKNMADCRWYIRVEPASKIRLLFAHLETEKDHDFVFVHDGSSVDSVVLSQQSGEVSLPTAITSSSNEMLVRFTSNQKRTSTGFLAVYSSI